MWLIWTHGRDWKEAKPDFGFPCLDLHLFSCIAKLSNSLLIQIKFVMGKMFLFLKLCLRHIFSKTPLFLITAFVFSKLFYCSTVWSNISKTQVKKLQLVQNFAGRIVLGLRKYDPISEGLKSLNRRLPIADKLLLNDS